MVKKRMDTEVFPGTLRGESNQTCVSQAVDGGGDLDQNARGADDSIADPSARWGIEIVDPLESDQWDRLVNAHSDRSVFHTSAWARVLNRTYGHIPFYLRILEGDKDAALIPLMEVRSRLTGCRGVCVPFSDFAEPLLFREHVTEPIFRLLADLAQERNWKHLEIRGARKICPETISATPNFYGHRMNLSEGFDALEAKFSSSVRRAIGKANRSGLSVSVSYSKEAMREYFGLHSMTRKRHGLPPQPRSFFESIHRELIESGSGLIVLAKSSARAVAGAVFLRSGDSAVYKFGASDEADWKFRPNNMVMSEGIRQLICDGAKMLHFGRTALEHDGLRRFKLSWGTEEEGISYIRYDGSLRTWTPVENRPVRIPKAIFGNMPLVLNRIAGSVIYPHLD